uniref:DDE-1 domain-containing protein n=1 Tax=Meloidogyne incognita TaxID=6306 RepID=A0A914NZP4_MELIC
MDGAPSMMTYLSWVADAWDSLPEEDIKKSFKNCGITNDINGLEDDQIHCFKTQIPSGLETLRRAAETESLNDVTNLFDEIDLLQDEENGFLSDNSIEF